MLETCVGPWTKRYFPASALAEQTTVLLLNPHLSTDSIRRAASELTQSMLTLAHLTEGHANFQIGGGLVPFDYVSVVGDALKDALENAS